MATDQTIQTENLMITNVFNFFYILLKLCRYAESELSYDITETVSVTNNFSFQLTISLAIGYIWIFFSFLNIVHFSF